MNMRFDFYDNATREHLGFDSLSGVPRLFDTVELEGKTYAIVRRHWRKGKLQFYVEPWNLDDTVSSEERK